MPEGGRGRSKQGQEAGAGLWNRGFNSPVCREYSGSGLRIRNNARCSDRCEGSVNAYSASLPACNSAVSACRPGRRREGRYRPYDQTSTVRYRFGPDALSGRLRLCGPFPAGGAARRYSARYPETQRRHAGRAERPDPCAAAPSARPGRRQCGAGDSAVVLRESLSQTPARCGDLRQVSGRVYQHPRSPALLFCADRSKRVRHLASDPRKDAARRRYFARRT